MPTPISRRGLVASAFLAAGAADPAAPRLGNDRNAHLRWLSVRLTLAPRLRSILADIPRIPGCCGPGSPVRTSWATVDRASHAQQAGVDCTEALKRAALPARGRTSAVVAGASSDPALLMLARAALVAGRSATGFPRTFAATPRPLPTGTSRSGRG